MIITEIPPNANDEVSEWRTSPKFNKSFEEFDPISNWVKEVEPHILKEQFYNVQDLKNSTAIKERKSIDYFKYDEPFSRNENKFHDMKPNSLKSETEFKSKSENVSDKESDGQMFFFKSFTSCEGKNKSDEKLSQSYKNVPETVCTQNKARLSQSISDSNKKIVYPTIESCLNKLICDEQKNDSINNTTKIEDNFHLPIIVVPPKESVAHLSVESDFDLPIILEKSFSISKNYENRKETENYLNYSEENENNFESCFNKLSEKSDTRKVSTNYILNCLIFT